MSVERLGIKTVVSDINEKVKNIIAPPKEPEAKIAVDSVKTMVRVGKKNIPANIFKADPTINNEKLVCETPEQVSKQPQDSTKCVNIKKFVVNPNDKAEFNQLFKNIDKDFSDRYTGKEAKAALAIINNPRLLNTATDLEKITLLRVVTYQLDEVDKKSPEYKNMLKSVDTVVDDFKSRGKINKLTEYLGMALSNTGFFMAGLDDWGAQKMAANPKILSATTPSQKTDMLYKLKFGYTSKKEEKAIVDIVKNSVDNGQFKSLMGYWSDGLDRTSSSMDALYGNLTTKNKTDFLETVDKGMKKESVSEKLMDELYGGKVIVEDIGKLSEAKNLEKQGKYSEAGKLYSAVGDLDKSKAMFEMAGYQNMQKGDYLGLVKNFISHSKVDIKSLYDSGEKAVSKIDGTHLTRTATTFVSDKMDNAFKDHPILQAKNVLVLKEEREKSVEKIQGIKVQALTPEQKAADKQKFEAKIDELTGTKAHGANQTKLLLDGQEASERLKQRIENAKESIFIEAFLYHDDKIGNEIADLLIKKANEGLDVRVITDASMNSTSAKVLNKLKNSKVKFLKNKGGFSSPIENRGMSAYHRKMYIFDKKAAMTGGINIGDEYLTKGKWHDLLVEVQGPIMSDTLNDFYKHWNFSSGQSKDKLEKAPPPQAFKNIVDDLPVDTKNAKLRLLTTDPNNKEKDIKTWMYESIKNAKERVFIQDPYFNDPEIVNLLKDAINRGVKVEVIFPNSNDVPLMKHLDDNVLDELYAAGANVYMYNTSGKESFNHLKATVVDDYVSLGSSNKDVRALNTNQEINYVIDDKDFTNMFLQRVWEKDKSNSQPAEPSPENFVKRLVKQGLKQVPSLF